MKIIRYSITGTFDVPIEDPNSVYGRLDAIGDHAHIQVEGSVIIDTEEAA